MFINENSYAIDYFIYFIGYNKHIYLFHYSFNFEKEEHAYIKKREINEIVIGDPKSLSCQIHTKNKELICFYIIKPKLYVEIFNINNNFITIYKNQIDFKFKENNDNITLKSSISTDESKILLCWEQKGNKAYYNYFLYNNKYFSNFTFLDYCQTSNQLMEIFFLIIIFSYFANIFMIISNIKFLKWKRMTHFLN